MLDALHPPGLALPGDEVAVTSTQPPWVMQHGYEVSAADARKPPKPRLGISPDVEQRPAALPPLARSEPSVMRGPADYSDVTAGGFGSLHRCKSLLAGARATTSGPQRLRPITSYQILPLTKYHIVPDAAGDGFVQNNNNRQFTRDVRFGGPPRMIP